MWETLIENIQFLNSDFICDILDFIWQHHHAICIIMRIFMLLILICLPFSKVWMQQKENTWLLMNQQHFQQYFQQHCQQYMWCYNLDFVVSFDGLSWRRFHHFMLACWVDERQAMRQACWKSSIRLPQTAVSISRLAGSNKLSHSRAPWLGSACLSDQDMYI